jgi:hypothetical protein
MMRRAGLETDSAPSNAQPLLSYTRRSAQSRQRLLQSLASSERDLAVKNSSVVETRSVWFTWDKSAGRLMTERTATGVEGA